MCIFLFLKHFTLVCPQPHSPPTRCQYLIGPRKGNCFIDKHVRLHNLANGPWNTSLLVSVAYHACRYQWALVEQQNESDSLGNSHRRSPWVHLTFVLHASSAGLSQLQLKPSSSAVRGLSPVCVSVPGGGVQWQSLAVCHSGYGQWDYSIKPNPTKGTTFRERLPKRQEPSWRTRLLCGWHFPTLLTLSNQLQESLAQTARILNK